MSEKPDSAEAKTKWCVCHVATRTSLIWKATGQKNAEGQAEYQCKICGATAWRPA